MTEEKQAPVELVCNFCGKKQSQVGIMIAAQNEDKIVANICDHCVALSISACVDSGKVNAVTHMIGTAIMKGAEDVLRSFSKQPQAAQQKPELVKQ